MLLLSIESSCDDTSFAVGSFKKGRLKLEASIISSQTKIHQKYGGVVPNLSAREHLKNFKPLLSQVLKRAGVDLRDIDGISIVPGPGLIPSLLVGVAIAKTLAYSLGKPLIPIHHIEGHIYSNWLAIPEDMNKISFPALALVVSGGHTQLIFMKDHLEYETVGETKDDAAGEAFDKVARMLGLGYPGGPAISKLASMGDAGAFAFPRGMIGSGDLNFSFSGLKTAVLYTIRKNEDIKNTDAFLADVSASFQQAVIDVLIKKTATAIKSFSPRSLLLAGGVSANTELRNAFVELLPQSAYIPPLEYCGDNAAMQLPAAFKKAEINGLDAYRDGWSSVSATANLRLGLA